ncbi:MAG: SdpI family protein [Aureispira sp.]
MTATTNFVKTNGLLLILTIAPLVYLLVMWSSIPETVPLHWNFKGEPDRYGSKQSLLWLLVGLNLFMYLFLLILPRIAARKEEIDAMGSKYNRLRFVLQLFVAMLSGIIVLMASGQVAVNQQLLLGSCFLLFMLLFGNYVGSIRPNYFIGIRTPWTLQSDTVWRKTHRLTGRLLLTGVVLGFILLFSLPSSWGMMGVVSVLVAALLFPAVYSFFLFKKEQAST